MDLAQSLIGELEGSLRHGSHEHRGVLLRRVTDLFLANMGAYSDEQIGLFDNVMLHLADKIERQALIELSGRLAPVVKAPVYVLHHLSRYDDIAVAGPVLERSLVLPDSFLVEIAQIKSQAHLAAIAGRARIDGSVTDVLVDRGNIEVTRKVTGNAGASFTPKGFSTILSRATRDELLAAAFARRTDLPPEIFDDLVRKATAAVKQKLMAHADDAMRARINKVLDSVARQVARAEASRASRGGGRVLMPDGDRRRTQLVGYAEARKAAETIDALAAICDVPVASVKNVVRQGSGEGLLILGKAAGLGWPDLKHVLAAAMPGILDKPDDEKNLFEKFLGLSSDSAQRALRFIKLSKATSRDDLKKMM